MTHVDRAAPPLPGAPRRTEFPPFHRVELANGAQILAIAIEQRAPLVALELACPAGAELDPPGRRGLATFTAGLLDEGTARRSSSQIAADVESLGGALSTGADWNAAYLRVGLLAAHRQTGLELLAEVLTQPIFPEAEVERLRRQRLAELLRRRNEPGTLADERLARVLYGDGPYGGWAIGDEAAVESYSRADCVGFYQAHCAPRGSFLLAAGDLDLEELGARASELLAAWPARRRPAARPTGAAAAARRPHGRHRRPPGRGADRAADRPCRRRQAPPRPLRADRAPTPCSAASSPAASTSTCASATASPTAPSRASPSGAGRAPSRSRAAVGNEVAGAAAREVLAELERLRQEAAPESELAETRSYLLGVFPYGLQTAADLVRKLAEIAVHGLPDDHYRPPPGGDRGHGRRRRAARRPRSPRPGQRGDRRRRDQRQCCGRSSRTWDR